MALIASRSRVVISERRSRPHADKVVLGERLADFILERAQLRKEMADQSERFRVRDEELRRAIMETAALMQDGQETVAVECPVFFDLEAKRRVVKHPETGAVLEDVEMTDSDWSDVRAQGLMEGRDA